MKSSIKKQAKFYKENRIPLSISSNLLDHGIDDYAASKKAIINTLIEFSTRYFKVYPSQETIAKRTGYSREWVNKMCKQLVEEGVIRMSYKHYDTCLYELSTDFYNPAFYPIFARNFNAYRHWIKKVLRYIKLSTFFFFTQGFSYNDIYINNLFRVATSKATDEYSVAKIISKIREEGSHMKQDLSNSELAPPVNTQNKEPLPEILQKLTWGSFTLEQKIKLAAFADETIEDIQNRIPDDDSYIRDKFAWFYKLCKTYTATSPDYAFSNALEAYYNQKIDNEEEDMYTLKPASKRETPPESPKSGAIAPNSVGVNALRASKENESISVLRTPIDKQNKMYPNYDDQVYGARAAADNEYPESPHKPERQYPFKPYVPQPMGYTLNEKKELVTKLVSVETTKLSEKAQNNKALLEIMLEYKERSTQNIIMATER